VKIYPGSKCLDGRDDPGHQLVAGCHLKITSQGAESTAAELPQQPAVVLEEEPEHLGDDKDNLTMRDIQEKCLPHPLSPLFQPLRMARGTEAAGAAREHQEAFRMAVRTTNAGEPAARVAAVQVALDDFLDDRAEEAILLLKTSLVLRQETVEVMK